ncbi:exodeoxyribonuclease III [candidate division WOR-3 bacterium]|nr:exodeoxyribonuclease III [candidate division WOR-3 bacterium]
MPKLTLLSWNVNGIRAIYKKGFLNWFSQMKPDFLGVQEIKADLAQVPKDLAEIKDYEVYYSSAEKKGYAGTGVFSKRKPLKIEYGLGQEKFDKEGRLIILHYPEFIIFSVYIPNGSKDNYRVPYKLEYSDKMLEKAEGFRKEGKAIIICGDLNTAHKEIDLARPRENRKSTGFLPEECAWLDKFVGYGYVDTFRHFYPDKREAYSWWNQRFQARERNVGWRIDYFFTTPDLLPGLKSAFILSDVMGSDHCPVGIEIEI